MAWFVTDLTGSRLKIVVKLISSMISTTILRTIVEAIELISIVGVVIALIVDRSLRIATMRIRELLRMSIVGLRLRGNRRCR